MYNEELKLKFLEGYTKSDNTKKVAINIFNSFECYELEWGADLCTKTTDELQEVFDKLTGMRQKSKRNNLAILRAYGIWCIENNIPNACDGLLNLKNVGINKVKSQSINSPLHLQAYLNELFESESEKTLDNMFRCYYWLAFSGLKEEEALQITASDVDFENMQIRYNGLNYPIYREALPSIKNCIDLNSFIKKHPSYGSTVVWIERGEGTYLIRGFKSNPNAKTIRQALSHKVKKWRDNHNGEYPMNKDLSYYKIWLSGLFYKMYESELYGVEVDFTDAAMKFVKDKDYKFEKSRMRISEKIKEVARDYKNDYLRWKEAYSY